MEYELHIHDMRPADMVDRIGKSNPVILECGCHDGRDTEQFLAAFPDCSIHCFEPDLRPLLRSDPPGFMCRFGTDSQVLLLNAAVSDTDGRAIMHRSSGTPPGTRWNTNDWDHSSSLCRPTGHLAMSPWCTFPESKQLEVDTIRLDTWLAMHPQIRSIDLIWADVQGAEAMLIRGADRTLAVTRWFYTEFYDDPMYENQPNLAELQAMLPEFDLVAVYGGYNALFCRKGLQT